MAGTTPEMAAQGSPPLSMGLIERGPEGCTMQSHSVEAALGPHPLNKVPASQTLFSADGRGLHSFPFPLNLSLLCPVLLTLSLLCPPDKPSNPWMWPERAPVELSRERCVREGPQVEL
jgi:hypothetical protein